jgi:hypothetical protein
MTVINRNNTTARVGYAEGNPIISHLTAAEALTAATPCVITAAGVKMSGSGVLVTDSQIAIHGWTGKAYANGDPVTLFIGEGARFNFGSNLTTGCYLYVNSGSQNGLLGDAAMTFTLVNSSGSAKINDQPAALIVSSTDIISLR